MEPRRRERRPPATLRTKTGCINCRSRRRKCDEHQPTCLACSKRKLECAWPAKAAQKRSSKPLHAESICRSPTASARSPAWVSIKPALQNRPVSPLFRCDHLTALPKAPSSTWGVHQELLNHYASNLCSVLIRSNAHPGFEKHFLMSSILPRLQLMMDPLLACASLDLSKHSPQYRGLAMKYYSQAVSIIRQKIDQKLVQGTEDWLLLNVLHLNLFETWNASSSPPVFLHIRGAAQILKLRGVISPFPKASAIRSTSDEVFARIAVEAFIYHTVSWSIFNGDPLSMPASELWDFIEPYFSIRPFPTASDADNSPVLGVPWQLYRFLSDLTQLTHRWPLSLPDYTAVIILTEELDAWESEYMTDAGLASEPGNPLHSLRYHQRARLFILALRLLLFKFLSPATPVSDPTIQEYVNEAIQLVRLHIIERFHFWPLLVIGSAVIQREQAHIIRGTLEDISRTMHSGAFIKTKCVLETIWARTITAQEHRECEIRLDDSRFLQSADGLDLLLGRDGILGLLNC